MKKQKMNKQIQGGLMGFLLVLIQDGRAVGRGM